MNDYGAGGAALFDIVNVQIRTRRRAGARNQLFPLRERRRDPFVALQSWLSSSGRALAS
jgi:hypothetical protein